ncbi:MAG: HD domain-containing protein [Roseiflexus sp.]|nr:HD domain-containing protein [Roseiflexus sp.]MCS7289929.1 HD domain-containing protein [Roseiflexus sp.]MDW8146744.1 HD domain-containing protein [Roseiflexaceae bacterium]MDW8232970.1 HD domain-containing protein [Roseiflexaceae bacterium]
MNDQTAAVYAQLAERIISLKLLPRTGWLQRGVTAAESVAEHSFGAAALALVFTAADDSFDRERVLAMALVHDFAEALLGDLPLSARRLIGETVKRDAERRAIAELCAALPGGDRLMRLWEEYVTGASREARFVKALDRVETLVQALAYERAGNRSLDEFWVDASEELAEFPDLAAFVTWLAAQRPR